MVWVVLGYFRANFPFYCIVDGGFPWYMLGYGQFRFLTLIQIVDVTGVYGVTFLVAAVNALVFSGSTVSPPSAGWSVCPLPRLNRQVETGRHDAASGVAVGWPGGVRGLSGLWLVAAWAGPLQAGPTSRCCRPTCRSAPQRTR